MQAGYNFTTGGNWVCIGYEAAYTYTTTGTGVAVGYRSQKYATGADNCSLGGHTMEASSCTGGYNTAIGQQALSVLTSGAHNT